MWFGEPSHLIHQPMMDWANPWWIELNDKIPYSPKSELGCVHSFLTRLVTSQLVW